MPDNMKNKAHTQPETPTSTPSPTLSSKSLQLVSCVTSGRQYNLCHALGGHPDNCA